MVDCGGSYADDAADTAAATLLSQGITKLDGYFAFNAQKFCLTNGSIKYSLGDEVKIQIQSVNNSAYKIDFDLATDEQDTEQ